MAGDTEAALALAGEVEWMGRALKVRPVTLKIEALFGRVLQRAVVHGLERCRDASEQVYQDGVRQHLEDLAAYEYEWAGRIARAATRTEGGLRELAYLCVADLQPTWTRQEHDQLFADPAAWQQLKGTLRHLDSLPKNGSAPSQGGAAPSAPPT